MSTHYCKMFEGTRFWKEANYISFRPKKGSESWWSSLPDVGECGGSKE